MKLVTYDTGDGVGRPGALVNDGTAIADLAANSGGAVASVLWIAQGGESALAQAEDAAKGAATVALDAVRLMAPIEPPPQMRDCLCFETHLIQAFQQARKLRASQMPDPAAAEPPQLLADGEVFMGSTYNGRLFSVIEEQDQPVAMMWDAQVFDLDGWIIPEGLPEDRLNRVKHFVKFATDTQRLADQAKYISYGPARESSAPLVGQHAELGIEMGPHMPTDPANATNTFLYNYEWWADYRDDIDAKFQAWLAQ